MIPNRCAKTRVNTGDTVVQVYSCFVNHPKELPPEEWKLLGDVLVDKYSAKLLRWHDTAWVTHHDTIVAAKIDADVDERSANYIKVVRSRLAENPYEEPTVEAAPAESTPDEPESSDNTHSESKGHTSTTLHASFEKLSVS